MPLKISTHSVYLFTPKLHIFHDWLALVASAIKGVEIYILCKTEKEYGLGIASGFTWFYFFVSATTLQALRSFPQMAEEAVDGDFDILAGQLPTTKRPGESRKIFLGASGDQRQSLLWKITWGLGSFVSASSLVAMYLLLGRTKDRTLYIWAAFQALWLVLRMLFYHFAEVADPMAQRLVTDRPWKAISIAKRERVLALMLALAKYQIHIHPRGSYSYPEDMLSTTKLINVFYRTDSKLHLEFPLEPTAKCDDTIHITMVEVIGDTVLTSSAWMLGSRLTGMDLYDSCLIVVNIQGKVIAIPAARVFSYLQMIQHIKIDVESSISPEVIPKGANNAGELSLLHWYYWIPCREGLWLEIQSEDRTARILGARQARVLSSEQLTQKLGSGELISLTSVDDVKHIVNLSKEAGRNLLDLWNIGEARSNSQP